MLSGLTADPLVRAKVYGRKVIPTISGLAPAAEVLFLHIFMLP